MNQNNAADINRNPRRTGGEERERETAFLLKQLAINRSWETKRLIVSHRLPVVEFISNLWWPKTLAAFWLFSTFRKTTNCSVWSFKLPSLSAAKRSAARPARLQRHLPTFALVGVENEMALKKAVKKKKKKQERLQFRREKPPHDKGNKG